MVHLESQLMAGVPPSLDQVPPNDRRLEPAAFARPPRSPSRGPAGVGPAVVPLELARMAVAAVRRPPGRQGLAAPLDATEPQAEIDASDVRAPRTGFSHRTLEHHPDYQDSGSVSVSRASEVRAAR